MDQQQPDSKSIHGDLMGGEQCAFCRKHRRDLIAPLKRCRGCSVAVYCGPDCQRKSWPTHKLMCKGVGMAPEARRIHLSLGYPSGIALMKAVEDWSTIHMKTLDLITNTFLWQHEGVNANLAAPIPRALVFLLKAVRHRPDSNPAKAFKVVSVSMVDKLPENACILSEHDWQSLEKAAATWAVKGLFSGHKPGFAGAIPVAMHLPLGDAGPVVLSNACHVFHTKHAQDTALSESTKTVLEDFSGMCLLGINLGHIYEYPTDAASGAPPIVHDYAFRRNKWRKVPAGPTWNWDEGGAMAALMAREPWRFKSGLSPRTLWEKRNAL